MEQPTSWIAVAMALIAMIGTAVNVVNQRRAARDKLEFDAELVRAKTELKQCREGREELRRKVEVIASDLAECTKRHALSEARIASLQERIARLEGGSKG